MQLSDPPVPYFYPPTISELDDALSAPPNRAPIWAFTLTHWAIETLAIEAYFDA